MKFDLVQLQESRVPTWEEHYIHYDRLKTMISELWRQFNEGSVDEEELNNDLQGELSALNKIKSFFKTSNKKKAKKDKLSTEDEHYLSELVIPEGIQCSKEIGIFLIFLHRELLEMDAFFKRKEAELHLELET
ncbi:hypothetical protein WICPIJ_000146, partial [Wickerhamomyces pijperi]